MAGVAIVAAAGARYTSAMDKPSPDRPVDGPTADGGAARPEVSPLVPVADLPHGRALPCRVGGRPVLLYRSGETVRAVVNRCPHVGTPLDMSPGNVFTLDGRYLICATHGALFDPSDGRCVSGPCRNKALESLPVSVRDGQVWLAVPD